MCILSSLGTEPVSYGLAGRLLTSGPPGKSQEGTSSCQRLLCSWMSGFKKAYRQKDSQQQNPLKGWPSPTSWAGMALPTSQPWRVKVRGLPATLRDGPLTPEPSEEDHSAAERTVPRPWGSPFQWLGSTRRVLVGQGPMAVT